ncbi:MAG: hypothetical protein JSW09_02915 [Pseudomonadota bacterium]|nr:MAG: hypothetical protein JSW09_02915 [Pseudomonadota bacterium]
MADADPSNPPTPALPTDSKDVAWVAVPAYQSPDELARMVGDVEMMFRLNPYWIFSKWRKTGPDSFHAEFKNESNGQNIVVDIAVVSGPGRGVTASYNQGLKKRTFLTAEPFGEGSRLLVVDDYESLPEADREARLAEVDKSLKAWGESLRVYFLRMRRYGWIPGWKGYMRRIWGKMTPSGRRIVWWIYIITVAEFFFFLFVLAIWVLEQDKPL